jgi:hypothetical protein
VPLTGRGRILALACGLLSFRHATVTVLSGMNRFNPGGSMKWRNLVVASLAGLIFASLMAQTPPSKPGPEHKRMDYYVGTWTVDAEVKASPFGPAGKTTGKQTVEWLPGGFFVVFRWDAKTTMGPVQGMGVMGYNAAVKSYTFNGFDSLGWNGIGKTMPQGKVWTWATEDYFGDKAAKGRYTATEMSPTSYSFKYEMQGEDGTWSTIEEGKATKTN